MSSSVVTTSSRARTILRRVGSSENASTSAEVSIGVSMSATCSTRRDHFSGSSSPASARAVCTRCRGSAWRIGGSGGTSAVEMEVSHTRPPRRPSTNSGTWMIESTADSPEYATVAKHMSPEPSRSTSSSTSAASVMAFHASDSSANRLGPRARMRRVRPKPMRPEVSRTQQEKPSVGSSSSVCSTVVGRPDSKGKPGPGSTSSTKRDRTCKRGGAERMSEVPKVVVMSPRF